MAKSHTSALSALMAASHLIVNPSDSADPERERLRTARLKIRLEWAATYLEAHRQEGVYSFAEANANVSATITALRAKRSRYCFDRKADAKKLAVCVETVKTMDRFHRYLPLASKWLREMNQEYGNHDADDESTTISSDL
jgi:hypothetical protein